MNQHNARTALMIFVGSLTVVFVLAAVFLFDFMASIFRISGSATDQMEQLLTLTAVICLVVIALAVLISRAIGVYYDRQIAHARAVTHAYDLVRQDFEWKNPLYHRERHHPSLPPTEVDPTIRKIRPFVPIKRPMPREHRETG